MSIILTTVSKVIDSMFLLLSVISCKEEHCKPSEDRRLDRANLLSAYKSSYHILQQSDRLQRNISVLSSPIYNNLYTNDGYSDTTSRDSPLLDAEEADPSVIDEQPETSHDRKTPRDEIKIKTNVYSFNENCFLAWAKEQTAWKWDYIVKQYNARITKQNVLSGTNRPHRNRQAIEFHYRTLKQIKFSDKPEVSFPLMFCDRDR